MLTIDLGQQYIDFFSLFRQTLLKDPTSFFYSFQKSIGGEMIGLWSYYLLSPFNLILLLFKESQLTIAVTFITYLKILCMSLSFQFFIQNKYSLSTLASLAFSFSYALMSYVIVYSLNIMWLDGLIMLPLIAYGLENLINHRKIHLYVIFLSIMLIINYYIGFMICIFLAVYTVYVINELPVQVKLKQKFFKYCQFIFFSLNAVLIASITLIPTLNYLLITKSADSNFEWELKNTFDFSIIFSKLFNSSFVFEEIKNGAPNLYAGALIILLFALYFLQNNIRLTEKITAVFILLFFTFTFYFNIPNQLWHGGQNPIWYPYRYSFLLTFFMSILAIKAYKNIQHQISKSQTLILIFLTSLFTIYYLHYQVKFDYLDTLNLMLTLFLFFVIIVILQLGRIELKIKELSLVLIVVIDLLINSVQIMNEFNYVNFDKFDDYTELLGQTISDINHDSTNFYRIHKNYARTKDEAFFAHYNGLDNFSSTIEASTSKLFGYLGLPDTSGNATYANGTIFTDDFFSIKYLLEPNPDANEHLRENQFQISKRSTDLDVLFNPLYQQNDRINIYENTDYFGLGIEVSNRLLTKETMFLDHNPIHNQELLLQLIDYQGTSIPYFKEQPIEQIKLIDVSITDKGDGNYFTYHSLINDVLEKVKGTILYQFKTTTKNPYYFTLPSQFDNDNVSLVLDEQPYVFNSPFRKRQITNAAFNSDAGYHLLEVSLLEQEIKANQIYLYEFDLPRYQKMIKEQLKHKFNVQYFSNTLIKGKINFQQANGQLLFTIPYDESWNIEVDGQKVRTYSVLNNTLMSIDLTKGEHQIVLKYLPKSIKYGTIMSIIGIILFILVQSIFIFNKNNEQNGVINEKKYL